MCKNSDNNKNKVEQTNTNHMKVKTPELVSDTYEQHGYQCDDAQLFNSLLLHLAWQN